MSASLAFVLAPHDHLPPDGPAVWGDLLQAQSQGIREAQALRLFDVAPSLVAALPGLGFEGTVPAGLQGQERCRLICDAAIPRFAVDSLWLAAYAVSCDDPQQVHAVDRFPLREAHNEACWFYPTDDGTYLSWQNARQLTLGPGTLADPAVPAAPEDYRRSDVHVLWSLMADDPDLTCVGITWKGVRIAWPELDVQPAAIATWRAFEVVSSASPSYRPLALHTVHPA
ncbi:MULTISPECIES: hypothetical protein [Aphanothece]|uniref:hypothetical protein n=1 Tax=Aphanothece TaxID=1121 RepID=UPI003984C5B6